MAARRHASNCDAGLEPYLSRIDTDVHEMRRRDTKAGLDFEKRTASRSSAVPSPQDSLNHQALGHREESRSNHSASAHSVPPSPSLSTCSIPSRAPSQSFPTISEFSNRIRKSDQITLSQHRTVSRSSFDDGDDTGLMVNVVPRRPMSPSTLTGSVVRNPSPSQSPSPREPGNFDLATLKRQFQNLSEAFIQLQAGHGKELEETKKAFSDLREEHNDYKKAFSDLREAHNESKTTVHWRLKKIEADLAKAFLEINKIRMHMQENLNRQAIDIRKNAEEIALHAKEEWQDASSDGSSVIRSLEQKMTELKVEVKALKNKKAGQRKSLANEDRKLGDA